MRFPGNRKGAREGPGRPRPARPRDIIPAMPTPNPLRIGVSGACGRMGLQLLRLVLQDPTLRLACALESESHPMLGRDAGACAGLPLANILVTSHWEAAPDVLVDFSAPLGTLARLDECERAHVPVVIGTTGIDAPGRHQLDRAAIRIPVFSAANMSLGIALLRIYLPRLAAALGEDVDVEIVETHHRLKKDAPSGTAIELASEIAKAIGSVASDFCHGRQGMVGERPHREIGIHAVRAGDIPGEHHVTLAIPGERIEVIHRAASRECFARGALQAARFLAGKPPGLYGMKDLVVA